MLTKENIVWFTELIQLLYLFYTENMQHNPWVICMMYGSVET